MNPGMFFLGAVSANEASRVGDAQCANGSDVDEDGVENLCRNKTRMEWGRNV